MKKLIISSIAIVAVCIAVNFAIASAESQSTPVEVNRTYIIKSYDGKVSCFEKDGKVPFLITEVETENLPLLDQRMLEQGVEVVGARAMSRALEDYRS